MDGWREGGKERRREGGGEGGRRDGRAGEGGGEGGRGLHCIRNASEPTSSGAQMSKALLDGNLDEKLKAILGCLREARTRGKGAGDGKG